MRRTGFGRDCGHVVRQAVRECGELALGGTVDMS
jgi:hypothetical protein